MNKNIGISIVKEQLLNDKEDQKTMEFQYKNIETIKPKIIDQKILGRIKLETPLSAKDTIEKRQSNHSKNKFYRNRENIKRFISKF